MSALYVSLGWTVDATLKASVLIAIVAIVQTLIGKRIGARWRHALWLVVVLRLLMPVAPSSRWSVFNLLPARAHAAMAASGVVAAAAAAERVRTSAPELVALSAVPASWRWIAIAWAAVAGALLLRSLIAAVRVHLLLRRRQATAVDDVDVLCREMGVRRAVRVVESHLVDAPALHGLFRPTLLLPARFTESFGRDELRHVVLHELWHLRRLDVAVNWLLSIVEAIHWFNPFVWFAASRIREERELACDELALSCLEEDERPGYGRTILKLLECFRTAVPIPALVGIINDKQKMKRRILMIASYTNRTRFSVLFAAVLSAVVLVGFTDARGGERRMMVRTLDPAAMQTVEKLDKLITADLKDATLGDVLTLVSSATGVSINQSAAVATSSAEQARFTLHAENMPAHALLHASLEPFHLAPHPDANGVTIDQAPAGEPGEHRMEIHREMHAGGAAGEGAAKMEKRIEMRVASSTRSSDGTAHRELTCNIDENGVKSEGKLVLDITGVK